MKRSLALAAVTFGLAASALPTTAAAQLSDQWKFGAIIYAYLPSISGKTMYSAPAGGGGGSSISINSDVVLDDLNFAFMGWVDAQKGRWGVFSDVIYVDVSGSTSPTRDLSVGGVPLPGNITADANLDVKGWVWTIGGNYRVVADPTATFDVLAGARMLDYKQTLGWTFSANLGQSQPTRNGRSELSKTNWDGIVGVKGRLGFGADRAWFVPYYVDVGTGDSDLTWQAIGGIGYSFKWGELLGGWRYLDYNFKSGSRIEDVNFNGPFLGVGFRW
jgi:hypothetical protein